MGRRCVPWRGYLRLGLRKRPRARPEPQRSALGFRGPGTGSAPPPGACVVRRTKPFLTPSGPFTPDPAAAAAAAAEESRASRKAEAAAGSSFPFAFPEAAGDRA